MNKQFITAIPLILVATLLLCTCSKEREPLGLSEINQQSQLELPQIGSDYYNFIVEISKPIYDDPKGINWRNTENRKVLRNSISTKWTKLINDSGLTREELKPVFKHFYKYNIYEFKSTFLNFKYGYLLEQFHENQYLKDKCNGLPCSSGTGIKYLCNRISLINDKIKDVPVWKVYDVESTEWYGANPYNRNKKILINGGKLSSGRHLKLKEKTLDRLIVIANGQDFDQLTKERKIGRFWDYSKYIWGLENTIKNLKDTQTSVINNWEPDNPAHINVCNKFN